MSDVRFIFICDRSVKRGDFHGGWGRITVNVLQFLHKLAIISNIKIVVPLLPEMLAIANQAASVSRCGLLRKR